MVVRREAWVPMGVAVFALLAAVYLGSRAFVLGYATAMVFLLFALNKFRVKKLAIIGAACLLLAAASILALAFKTDSSKGRMLIYKVSSSILKEHWPKGIGHDKFKTTYLHYQAAYFSEGEYTEKELLLAGNTYYAFNDHYQYAIEWGLLGALAMSVAIGVLLYGIVRVYRRQHQGKRTLYHIACVQLIAILIAAFFTHVYDKLLFQLLALCCIGVIVREATKPDRVGAVLSATAGLAIAVLLLYYSVGHKVRHADDHRHWKEGLALSRAGIAQEGLAMFETAYPNLHNHGPFLESYGYQLFSLRHYEKAAAILQEALQYRLHHRIYLALGKCYMEMGRVPEAEKALLKAVHMVPNRFESRLALFDFYDRTGRDSDATRWGVSILELPIKVPSLHVDRIREEVANRIKN
ncbi:O-antigen ligase family protein [Parapedobacter tibetensis]|uniref:O-antigen ligase family protein n=1 Tax=Parapedobacter tibetensis TaxID=2972951 RepID=UPI00214D3BF4|nr:O-antigen ligase family protein [Parapedobacter tibetensis]